MKRYFVGKKLDSVVRVVFQSGSNPSESSHGHIYSSVIGPFKTKRAAQFTAMFGSGDMTHNTRCSNDGQCKAIL